LLVYLVEERHPTSGDVAQIGGFLDEEEAAKLVARLASEGRRSSVNMVAIHRRWVDYEYDR
jgi:hypothetical protein